LPSATDRIEIKMKRILASLAIALGLTCAAQAATVTYDFSVVNTLGYGPSTVSGSFSYDDASAATTGPSGVSVGSGVTIGWYAASGDLNGIVPSSLHIGLVDNSNLGFPFPSPSDFALLYGDFTSTLGDVYGLVLFFQDSAFSSTNLAQLNGKSGSDVIFNIGGFGDNISPSILLSLTQRSADVPVPATLALMGMGLFGIAAARRKRV